MKRIKWIIVLILASTIGIISFQTYWLMDNYRVVSLHLKNNIHQSLSEALETSLYLEFKTKFNRGGTIPPNASQWTNAHLGKGMAKMNIKGNGFVHQTEIKVQDSILISIDTDTRIGDKDLDSVLHAGEQDSRMFIFMDSTTNVFPGADTAIHGIMEKVISLAFSGKQDIGIVDSLFAKELKNRGLDLAYDLFFLQNGKQTTGTKRHSESPDSNGVLISESYPDNFKVTAEVIGFNTLVFKSMWVNLLLSFLLTSIIVSCLIYMLLTIFKQKKMDEIKTDFINNMTHEFKTPIATVSAAIEALDKFGIAHDPTKTKNYLNIASGELDRLSGMVEKILDLAQLEHDFGPIRKERIPVLETIQPLIEKIGTPHPAASFVIDVPKDVVVEANRAQFTQIMSNLIENAAKYGGESPEVQIQADLEGVQLVLRVTDDGPGINKEYRNLVFEKFFRVPTGNVHNIKGYGLGLSHVKHLVGLHGWDIELVSLPGKGSSFNLLIPL